jgi:hypothetical protein
LAGVVIGRCAYAATRKHNAVALKCTGQCAGDASSLNPPDISCHLQC